MSRKGSAGAFELSRNGESIELATPAQRVLAFLALHEQPVRRNHVAGVLWLDSNEDHAAGSLRSALWRIRRRGGSIVEVTQRGLRLSPTVGVDVRETIAWARRVGDASHVIEDADVREAFTGGELLADWYDDWILLERERLRQLRLHALEILSQRLVVAGRYGEAMEVALVSIRSEPLRESAHRAVISVHLAEGNPSEALRQFRRYCDLIRAQFGLAPSALMKGLVSAVDVPVTAG
ncbi:MAG TPA: BTAD domain-containing putative transcriptional regulator [Candidatus Limnocylindria bacterium]|nr:BTAD domain-containing putative transcriptional regulator [Candidatus Limnocylindria bacterium]